MRELSDAQIKGLFYHLVKAVGGVEAAGAFLGVSHQRVSQLQSVQSDNMPTLRQVATLEAVVGQPIVTGALARFATGHEIGAAHIHEEVCEAVVSAADVLRAEQAGDQKAYSAAVIALKREVSEIPVSLKGDAA